MSDSESDEDLDWTLLLDSKVLKRGEKDHAPDGTEYQQSALKRSREAMYSVLSKPVTTTLKQIVECDWDPITHTGRVRKAKGKFFTTMGWAVRDAAYLYPEEICYLCQRGTMICYFEDEPLSVEGVLSLTLHFIGAEKLSVYSHLKKLGYVVRRDHHPSSTTSAKATLEIASFNCASHFSLGLTNGCWWLLGSRFRWLAWRPVYLQYTSVYRDLQCVSQKPIIQHRNADRPGFDYLVWKPSTKFRKSAPDNADYALKVVSADLPVPRLAEIETELAKLTPTHSEKRSVVTRMREGVRSMLLAVVDNGVVSFIRVGEPVLEQVH